MVTFFKILLILFFITTTQCSFESKFLKKIFPSRIVHLMNLYLRKVFYKFLLQVYCFVQCYVYLQVLYHVNCIAAFILHCYLLSKYMKPHQKDIEIFKIPFTAILEY